MATEGILGRPLIYQLLLVQLVFDKKESFEGIADALNDHALRKEYKLASTDGDEQVKDYYDDLLKHYNVVNEKGLSKGGVPRRTSALAELLYRQYCQSVLDDLEGDRKRFVELYENLDKTLPK